MMPAERPPESQLRVLRSMWHRNRKDFAEWTGDEIDRRAGSNTEDRKEATRTGLIKANRMSNKQGMTTTYTITALGRAIMEELNETGGSAGGDHPARRRLRATPFHDTQPRGNSGSRR